MAIKLTTGAFLNVNRFLQSALRKEMSARTSYKLARLANKLQTDLKPAEEKRIELIKKHGEKVEGSSEQFAVPQDKLPAFTKEWNEIADVEFSIEFDPIPLNEFDDVRFTPAEMIILEPFIQG